MIHPSSPSSTKRITQKKIDENECEAFEMSSVSLDSSSRVTCELTCSKPKAKQYFCGNSSVFSFGQMNDSKDSIISVSKLEIRGKNYRKQKQL